MPCWSLYQPSRRLEVQLDRLRWLWDLWVRSSKRVWSFWNFEECSSYRFILSLVLARPYDGKKELYLQTNDERILEFCKELRNIRRIHQAASFRNSRKCFRLGRYRDWQVAIQNHNDYPSCFLDSPIFRDPSVLPERRLEIFRELNWKHLQACAFVDAPFPVFVSFLFSPSKSSILNEITAFWS